MNMNFLLIIILINLKTFLPWHYLNTTTVTRHQQEPCSPPSYYKMPSTKISPHSFLTSFKERKSEGFAAEIPETTQEDQLIMPRHEELPVPTYSSLEPVYGSGSPLEEAQHRFNRIKSKFVEFYGQPPDFYARSPGELPAFFCFCFFKSMVFSSHDYVG